MTPRDAVLWVGFAAFAVVLGYAAGLDLPSVIVSYVISERLVAKGHTGSWTGFGSDLRDDAEETEEFDDNIEDPADDREMELEIEGDQR